MKFTSGNTYFSPLPVYQTKFRIRTDFRPSKIWSMIDGEEIAFSYEEGHTSFEVSKLIDYEGIVLER